VFVKDLTAFVVKGVAEINNVLNVGRAEPTVPIPVLGTSCISL
jgi:hypothetical protein